MDWRLTGQEGYLKGAKLQRVAYCASSVSNDHDHCEFCGAKFMAEPGSDMLTEGYCTEDRYRWICEQCFNDFKGQFQWNIA